jgi:phosphohistidine phosphatase
MNLYIVRHGEAKSIGGSITSDSERPLSPRGEQDVRLVGQVLARLEPEAPHIVSSPLLRARATAALLGEHRVPQPAPDVWEELSPGIRFKDVVSRIQSNGSGPLVIVGHQPDMTHMIAYLVADAAVEIALPPGGMAALTLPYGVGAGGARLLWLLTPDLIRSITPPTA